MKKILVILITFTILFAFAQPQGGDANPELRALIEPYINLTTSIGLILELEKNSDLHIASEQAVLMLPILNELSSSAGYTPERATEMLNILELEILSAEQLIWIDGEFLRQQEEAETAQANGQRNGLFGGFGGLPFNGQTPRNGIDGGQQGQRLRPGESNGDGRGGPGGLIQRLTAGETINIFIDNPAASDVLSELISLVSVKTEGSN